MNEAGRRHLGTVGVKMRGQDGGEVGGVDPEHALHRRARQAEFVTHHPVPVRQQPRHQVTLHPVGVGHRQGSVSVGERLDRHACAPGGIERRAELGNGGI